MDKYNKCEGCKLWNGHHCTGDRSYEPNGDKHKAICNEHMAKQFWIVYKQLQRKTAECEELKREIDLYKTWYRAKHSDVKNTLGRYRRALEEIEQEIHSLGSLITIQDIIIKAKDGKNETSEA